MVLEFIVSQLSAALQLIQRPQTQILQKDKQNTTNTPVNALISVHQKPPTELIFRLAANERSSRREEESSKEPTKNWMTTSNCAILKVHKHTLIVSNQHQQNKPGLVVLKIKNFSSVDVNQNS